MDDLISRQAAIEAAIIAVEDWEEGYGDDRDEFITYRLNELSSAQPQTKCIAKIMLNEKQIRDAVEKAKCEILAILPRWIPVTERLPESEGIYLITDYSGGITTVNTDEYMHCDDGTWVWVYSQNVIAWMPMPEGYIGEQEDGN